MSSISDAVDQLVEALSEIPNVRVYTDLGASIAPPGIIIGPPRVEWLTACTGPSDASFEVVLVVASNDRSLPALWDLIPLVGDALDNTDGVVRSASPGVWNAGGQDLPSYSFIVDYPLSI